MSEVVSRASAVHSTKRTAEVILVRLVEAEEEESGSGSSEMISEDVRGVPLQPWRDGLPSSLLSVDHHALSIV
jgi:hypothetical protein